MTKYPKGMESRSYILTEARKLLNEKGLNQTMEMLAKEMGLSRGKITNYFPTKESLLVNIMREYEHTLGVLLLDNGEVEQPGFLHQYRILSKIMDIYMNTDVPLLFSRFPEAFTPKFIRMLKFPF